MKQNVLTITQTDKTPLIEELLKKLADRHELIEKLDEENQKLKVEKQKSDEKIQKSKEKIQELEKTIRILKSEIAVLKKAPKRPLIRSNVKPKIAKDPLESSTPLEKRAGSEKKHKKLEIHETKILRPDNLPCDAKLKRTRKFDVQDLLITVHNIRYILEEWETADGQIYSAQMPSGVSQGHFGNELCSFILDQHHQCQVTQSLLYEQLTEFGIEISTGQIHNILTEDNELFHQEKNKILETALTVSSYIQVDDTGARHNGKNGYCTQIGNDFFAWFQSTASKSRINFLQILNSAYADAGYLLNKDAFDYMSQEKLPQISFSLLSNSIQKRFETKKDWENWLVNLNIINKNHIKIATEAALLAGALAAGLNKHLVILSDDAGQFNIPCLSHALCWIHEERHIKNLIPSTEVNRLAQQDVLDEFWNLYRTLKEYKKFPALEMRNSIQNSFDNLFKKKTDYILLDQVLKRIFIKKKELLVILENRAVPLHNNGSETDIREYVKRRKVSGGTRSLAGKRSRDTFASLKKTCRKLGVSFYAYLKDRLARAYKISPLSFLIEQAALEFIKLGEATAA